MFDVTQAQNGTVIKVIGVGGAGGNAVNHMAEAGIRGVEFICANTDAQALSKTVGSAHLQLGETGLGAGSDPEVGREAAVRERTRIAEMLKGAHMVFVTAGMGGGTGTGAAPVIAEVAKELGILTVGVVSKPFEFEGPRRLTVANAGIAALSKSVDSLIIVLNNRLEEVLGEDITQKQAFRAADDVLCNAVGGISEIINVPGMVNVDFQDVRTVMRDMGTAMMGTAVCEGEGRAVRAAQEAIACPLLDGTNLYGARGLLVNIAASSDTLKLRETREVMNLIRSQTSEHAIIKMGTVYDETLGDAMRVTVVATGLSLPDEVPAEQVTPKQFGAPQAVGHTAPMNPAARTSAPVQVPVRQAAPAQETSMFLRRPATLTPPPATAPAPAAQPAVAARPEVGARATAPNGVGLHDFGRVNEVPPFLRHRTGSGQ